GRKARRDAGRAAHSLRDHCQSEDGQGPPDHDSAADHAARRPGNRIELAVLAAGLFVASFARGYSGFGFSALLVSSGSLVTDPARLVVLALILEVLASVLQARSVWTLIDWRRVGLLLAGAAAGTPFGTWLLAHAPIDAMKAAIAIFVLIAAALLLAGF